MKPAPNSPFSLRIRLGRWLRTLALLAVIGPLAAPAQAETITIGLVGAVSATHWPIYVGLKQGFYAAQDIKLSTVFTLSSNALVQQLAAGSLDAALSTGIVDPIYAIDKGAPIAVLRLEMVSPPYALIAKPTIASIKDLKGKSIMVDGPKGITRLYVERMLTANGLKMADAQILFAGATSARFSALEAGAVDATILLPPFSFFADSAGFRTLGLSIDYTPELPFTGAVVNRTWAQAHRGLLDRLIAVHNRTMAWLLDPHNRQGAIDLMVEATHQKLEDVAKAYDFLMGRNFFDADGKVSRQRMNATLAALQELGDVSPGLDVDRLILPGVTQVTD
ncbi:MAG TPA: ABC transporter substrate-binding protein [Xanthobacteraceae bacterium]|nr:ABC transporter substrate-binding protein [Xanthobacteraceae bacterium]